MARSNDQAIDPAGEEPVLFYADEHLEDGHPRRHRPGVPARDLTGGDLARIAYKRAHRETPFEVRDKDGNAPALPRVATPHQLAKLADELVETGIYRRTKPDAPKADEAPTTDEPAAPAEG